MICQSCKLRARGGEADVESARVWHFYETHRKAWDTLFTTLIYGAFGPISARRAPMPSDTYWPRPAALPVLREVA